MAEKFMEITLTPAVQKEQRENYGRSLHVERGRPIDPLTERESQFISQRNSFYMATVNQDSWPYIQHKGGEVGFLKILSPNQIAFADRKGNRQLLSVGNLRENDKVALFLIDYPTRTRLKILGNARIHAKEDSSGLSGTWTNEAEDRHVERLIVIDVVSYDWNCPQYISPRFTEDQIAPAVKALKLRIQQLEEELHAQQTTEQ
ncbi:pyridoxamine 5'-phosphate oxidase family protein [Pelagicoccus albus]|uniref:Pyridoxamine 5'-phosphate oxidase family protein n=1 Tax=Pelagicoccus albus TaxID=415222 RepID=A0A7X1E8H0_9BACT|nr:pyridoxamine 5'-phosphate oxidase family protein [Pelagicoccus albus]MBC2604777.1 pyridoxamine 5'-phosphate oxidase family protein [Pelagicoccus albus]